MRVVLSFLAILSIVSSSFSQILDVAEKSDSLIYTKTEKPFNGIILIHQNGKEIYSKAFGYSNLENKMPLKSDDQFVIGSISKQITAVLVLREFDKGNLELDIPISKYLPELTQNWADKVTVRHLMTHMHGIEGLNKPLKFTQGTKFEYSQIGFDLLASIVERTSEKSFADLSLQLFEKCKMKNTFHPDLKKHKKLVTAYTENEKGELVIETKSFKNYVAAGCFVSTANDLLLWNKMLYEGQLLSKKAFEMLTTKQKGAIRDHPLFGKTEYGLGITIDTKDSILQYGQTGFASGFASIDFYYPETKTSFIILENIVYNPDDLANTFYYHTQILSFVRKLIKQ